MPFSSRSDRLGRVPTLARVRLPTMLRLLPLLLLAACVRQGAAPYGGAGAFVGGGPSLAPTRYYPPPGPPEDPWGPYIREAAARYGVPEQWIRAVMQQESGGEEQAVSPVGAMGLMQVMPETYEGLRERYNLGDDPYDPHNNILAGTAYIREMYAQFGAPGFLAAYNAGPDRVDSYLAGTAELPDETVNYLAAVTPNLGDEVPLSGPLARYAAARAGGAGGYGASVASLAAGCNLNLAYDPNHPCSSLERAAVASAPSAPIVVAQQIGAGGCNLDVAYDPSHPCSSVGRPAMAVASASPPPPGPSPAEAVASTPVRVAAVPAPPPAQPASMQIAAAFPPTQPIAARRAASTALQPAAEPPAAQTEAAASPAAEVAAAVAAEPRLAPPVPNTQLASADRFAPAPSRPNQAMAPGAAEPHLLALPVHDWAIQVGAFASPRLARAVAENARAQAPGQLRSATLALPPTPGAGSMLYRARLAHLSASAASDACWQLNQRQLPCVVVQPSRT